MSTSPASMNIPDLGAEPASQAQGTPDVPVTFSGPETPEGAPWGSQTLPQDPLLRPTAQELLVRGFRAARIKTHMARAVGGAPAATGAGDVSAPTADVLRKIQNGWYRGIIPPELRPCALRPVPSVSTYEATGVLILRSDGAVVFPTHGETTPVLRIERLLAAVKPLTFDEYAAAQVAGEAVDEADTATPPVRRSPLDRSPPTDAERAREALTPLYRITVTASATPVPAKDLASLWATSRDLPRKPTDPWLEDARLAASLERECGCDRCAYCLVFPLMQRLAQGILSTS